MPSPVKTGLFPAAPTTARTPGPASSEAGEAFHDELVRRSRAEGTKDQQAAPAGSTRGAKRAEKKAPQRAERAARTAADEAPQADAATSAGESASPQGATEAEGSPSDAQVEVEAEGADVAPHEADAEEAAANDPAVAAAAPPPTPVTAGSYGEAREPADEAAAPAHAAGELPSVYHAGAPGGEASGGEAADGGAVKDPVPGLFNGAKEGAAADDATSENPPAGAAASVAVSDAAPGSGNPGVVADASEETGPSSAITDDASTTTAVTARFSEGDLQVPGAPHRPRSDAPSAPTTAPTQAPTPPEVRFAEANHGNIVTSMRGELLPNGGSMRIRLDPPQLGALQVTVQIRDGLVTAAFETSSDEATRLLGHSLNHLKSVLESHGVAVDNLQVQQAPREAQAQTAGDDARREQGGQSQEQEQSARQEQQRREMLRRMWRRLAGGQDPLDLTA